MPIGLKVVPILLEELVEAVKGRKISYADAPAVHDLCQKRLTHMGHEGVAQMALSMFDMALHDALAREAGVPLYKLLGGSNEPLPTYTAAGSASPSRRTWRARPRRWWSSTAASRT